MTELSMYIYLLYIFRVRDQFVKLKMVRSISEHLRFNVSSASESIERSLLALQVIQVNPLATHTTAPHNFKWINITHNIIYNLYPVIYANITNIVFIMTKYVLKLDIKDIDYHPVV